MRLNELYIFKDKVIIRKVQFKDGVNLIVDSTSEESSSGNSIGKSTLSRVIDYIFLGKGKDIYEAPEFKKPIPEIVELIEKNEIYVLLTVTGFNGANYEFGRFLAINDSSKYYYINGEEVGLEKYKKILSEQVFGLKDEKPSLRNVVQKFIRNTHDKMQNTARFLHLNTKPDVYDQLYLYLFGFDDLHLLKEKDSINKEIKIKNKDLSSYRKPNRETALKKMLKPLEEEKKSLELKIKEFDFSDCEDKSVKTLVDIQSKITDLTIKYSNIESKICYLNKTIGKLRSNAAKVDDKELYEIYNLAGVSLNNKLKRKYEELMVFHNKVIKNKLNLINSDLEKENEKSISTKKEISNLQSIESTVLKEISEPETLKSIGQAYSNISEVREKIASVNTLIDQIENTKLEIQNLENSKDEVVNNINEECKKLDNNIEVFNNHFGELSNKFYGERYIFDLNFDIAKEKCTFDIVSFTPNSTGGKKKGELSAFDFSYIKFILDKDLSRPTFIIHDSIEDVDAKQVISIFREANKLKGQYIVSVLSDKISSLEFKEYRDNNIILELSENDKFFKI